MTHPIRPLAAHLTLHVTAHALTGHLCHPHDEARELLRAGLDEGRTRDPLDVHAYAMMDNHLHILLTAREEGAAARFMQRLLSRQARELNRLLGRRGPLWDDRYRSVPVLDEEHALHACLYIDANPWRARLVDHPRDSTWTSHRGLTTGMLDRFLVPHQVLLDLGAGEEWRARYVRIMAEYLRRASRCCASGRRSPCADPLHGLRLVTWRE
jgi:putative transposase